LRLAQLMLKDASVLILDEPTNDLDVATLEVLGDAIQNFNGAVILVTHDRYFMDQVSQDILSFPRRENPNKTLERFVGYLQWEEAWFAYDQEAAEAEAAAIAKAEADAAKAGAAKGGKTARLSFKLKNELEGMEAKILKMETDLEKSQAEAGSPEVVSNAKRLQELHSSMAQLQTDIEQSYARWAELEKMAKGE